jgi:HlyD family secretion protein
VRLNPTIQANVVTYNVVVEADNPSGNLLPGMTAHVSIQVAERRGVLRVPNAALSYRPKDREDDEPAAKTPRGTRVHVLADGHPVAVPVRTGITDGSHTEVVEGELKAGDKVIVRETAPKKDGSSTTFRFRLM